MSSIKDRLKEPAPTRPGIDGEFKQMRQNGRASGGGDPQFSQVCPRPKPARSPGRGRTKRIGVGHPHGNAGVRGAVGRVLGHPLPTQTTLGRRSFHSSGQNPKSREAAGSSRETAKDAAPKTAPEPPAPNPVDTLPDKLGIGETKPADPRQNPLDSGSSIDKLLDGIE